MIEMKKWTRTTIGIGLLVLWGAAGGRANGAAAAERPEDWPDERHAGNFSVSEEVVTPHSAWAKPLAGRPPRVLFIVPRWCGREVVEVAQRLTMEYAVVLTGGLGTFSGNTDTNAYCYMGSERPAQTTQRLNDALAKPWDAIVLGNVFFACLPENVRQQIEAKVRSGAGLLVTGNDQDACFSNLVAAAPPVALPEALTLPVPCGEPPLFAKPLPSPAYTACRLGTGTVVAARYDVGQMYSTMAVSPVLSLIQKIDFPIAYDYYQSMVVRALLFAAGRKFDSARMGSVGATPNVADHERTPSIEIKVTASTDAHTRKIRLRVRDKNDRVFLQEEKPGAPSVSFSMAAKELPVGRYFADTWLLEEQDAVRDWSTAAFSVTDAQGIATLAADTVPGADGAIGIKLELQRPLATNECVQLEVSDHFQRVVSRQTWDQAGQTGFTFRAATGNVLSLMAAARARIERDGKPVAVKEIAFPAARPSGQGPGWDDFSFMIWGFVDNAGMDPVFKNLEEAGLDRIMTFSSHAEHARIVAERYNCKAYPYASQIFSVWACRPEPLREQFGKLARALEPYGCDTYDMGDECMLYWGQPVEFSEQPLNDAWINASFQDYLKKQYPSLAALNAEWNTGFTNWAEVCGIALPEARKNNQEARWVDHRLHRETLFAGAFAAGEEGARTANARSRAGFEGFFVNDSFHGYDWAKLCANSTLFGHYWYPSETVEFIGSMKRPGIYWGLWNGNYGGINNRWTQGYISWRCLFYGMNSVWYFGPYGGAGCDIPYGMYFPDLRRNTHTVPFFDSLKEIKAGIGKLLLTSERSQAPIAIHYSQPSVHANTLDDAGFTKCGIAALRIANAQLNAAWSLKDAGLQPRFVASSDIANGDLKGCRALILPFSQAISAEECAQMRKFVEAGGVLIADVRPAVRDGHGKLSAKGGLDDLFGIERVGTNAPAAPEDVPVSLTLGSRKIEGAIPLSQPDPNVRTTTGKALAHACPEPGRGAGDTPLFILREVGKGRTLLLNFAGNYAPGSYGDTVAPSLWTTAPGDIYREIALASAELAGVKPEIAATTGKDPLRGIDIVTWRNGSATYYGFTPNDQTDYAWVIGMPDTAIHAATTQPGFFYDVRAGKFLGEGTEFNVELKRGSAALVARLPYKVDGLKLKGPRSVRRGETLEVPVTVLAQGGRVGEHVIRVEVEAAGKPLACYAANLGAARGQAVCRIPLALNDPTGAWRIRFRDVATGTKAECAVDVE